MKEKQKNTFSVAKNYSVISLFIFGISFKYIIFHIQFRRMSLIENSNDSSTSTPKVQLEAPKSVFFNIGKRSLDRDNIFKSYRADQKMKLSVSKLSDQQVLSSQTYQDLLQKFEKLQGQKYNQEQMKQKMCELQQKIKRSKQQTHYHKYQVWELKNQLMSLQQQLQNEVNEYNYLHECLIGENDNQQSEPQDLESNSQTEKYSNQKSKYNLEDGSKGDLFNDNEIFGQVQDDQQELDANEMECNQEEQHFDMELRGLYSPGLIKRISLRCSEP